MELAGGAVVARNEGAGLGAQQGRQALVQWFARVGAAAVSFEENANPQNDAREHYAVAYEARFDPIALDQARVEVWITTDGRISIGIETRKRVSVRLRQKNRRDGFAAGHEPGVMPKSALLAMLELIANGKIGISAKTLPFVGLTSTTAILSPRSAERLKMFGYRPIDWLRVAKQEQFSSDILHYRPWT